MRRREFITLLGGAAATWPIAARGQQAIPVIGFLSARSSESDSYLLAAFQKGLGSTGYAEGRNVRTEYRWARGQYDQLPAMAAELVRTNVSILVAAGGPLSALAAKFATSTIPTVFMIGTNPIELGLVASINRPGGNATGVTVLSSSLGSKRIGLLRELMPAARLIGVLVNPVYPPSMAEFDNMRAPADGLGIKLLKLNASNDTEISLAFAEATQAGANAILVTTDQFFNDNRTALAERAAQHAIPTVYHRRSYVAAGGLISYGNRIEDQYFQGGIYVGRILNGAAPAELPVMQIDKFELVINLKTAKTLGVHISDNLLSIADEVIE